MKSFSKEHIGSALREVGGRSGQMLYLQTDLRAPGRIDGVKTKQEFCEAYLTEIMDVIGSEGTLIVPTFTTQVARHDIDFVWEETPTIP